MTWSWKKTISAYKHRCAYCGRKTIYLTKDHVVARSKGGKNAPNNIVPCCPECNSNKANYEWKEWYKLQPFYSVDRELRIENHLKLQY